MQSIEESLNILSISLDIFESCSSFEDEFALIKKKYFSLVLTSHPDKGGDPATFRGHQTSFQILRSHFESKTITSYTDDIKIAVTRANYSSDNVPSYDFFQAAAEEPVPLYQVENAKSNRSCCVKCKSKIDVRAIRIGSLLEETGTYGRWNHLNCWRIPSKIWLGLPDPQSCDADVFTSAIEQMNDVIFRGFPELSEPDKNALKEYMMIRENWAKLVKKKKSQLIPVASSSSSSSSSSSKDVVPSSDSMAFPTSSLSDAVVLKKEYFLAPVPGENGARENALSGKTIVITGIFPEIGGGGALSLGKEKVKKICESFGGKVTGSVSGKTNILIVGHEPGAKKVEEAKARSKCKLMSIQQLKVALESGVETIDAAKIGELSITSYSKGPDFKRKAIQDVQKAQQEVPQVQRKLEEDGKASKKQKKSASVPLTSLDSSSSWSICCDHCSANCTDESYFFEESQVDVCPSCYTRAALSGGIRQSCGQTIKECEV